MLLWLRGEAYKLQGKKEATTSIYVLRQHARLLLHRQVWAVWSAATGEKHMA